MHFILKGINLLYICTTLLFVLIFFLFSISSWKFPIWFCAAALLAVSLWRICSAKRKTQAAGPTQPSPLKMPEGIVLCGILCSGLLLRILFSILLKSEPYSDFANYWMAAGKWAEGSFVGTKSWTTTGYYALIIQIFGQHLQAVWLVNSIVGTLQVFLAFTLGRELFRRNSAGLISAAAIAFYPSFLLFTPVVSSEIVFGTLLLLIAFCFLRLCRHIDVNKFSVKSILLAILLPLLVLLTFWCRGTGIFLLPATCIVLFFLFLKSNHKKSLILFVVLPMIFGYLFYCSTVALANRLVTGNFAISCSSNSYWPFLFGSSMKSLGSFNLEDRNMVLSRVREQYGPNVAHPGSRESLSVAKEEFLNRWKNSPMEMLKLGVAKSEKLWRQTGGEWALSWTTPYAKRQYDDSDLLFTRSLSLLLKNLFCLCAVFAVLFYRRLRGEARQLLLMLSLFLLANVVLHFVAEIQPRYNYPVMMVLAVLCGAPCAALTGKKELHARQSEEKPLVPEDDVAARIFQLAQERILPLYRRFEHLIKYCLIGVTGVTLDFICFALLVKFTSIHYQLASIISVSAGIINNFIWNVFFNFKTYNHLLLRFLSFYAVGTIGIGITALLLYLLIEQMNFNTIISKLVVIFIVTAVQFSLNKWITFRSKACLTD